MELNITSFDVRQWSCLNDTFIVIRDDWNSSGSVLAALCYKHDNFPITVRSSGNAMSVEAVNKWKGLSFNARYQVYDLNRGGKKTDFFPLIYVNHLLSVCSLQACKRVDLQIFFEKSRQII